MNILAVCERERDIPERRDSIADRGSKLISSYCCTGDGPRSMNIMRLSPALAASQYVSKLHGNARAKRIGKLGIGHSTVADMSDVDSTDSGRERVSASSYRHRLSEIWIGHLQTVHGRRSALSRGRYRCSWQHRRIPPHCQFIIRGTHIFKLCDLVNFPHSAALDCAHSA